MEATFDTSQDTPTTDIVKSTTTNVGCDASMLLKPTEVMGSEKITLPNESVPANEPDQIRKITRYDKELDEKRKALVSLENEERKPAGVKLEHKKIWMLLTNFQVPGPSSIIFALQVKRIILFI
uniref:Uncharacterized protein n=1 Tax=Tanacetum cinerariifolium TaxID=118510 RepID=A0A6L2K437_TANCI|nr:hypothetical protein [Tanacetum cinerariifolium]